MSLETPRTIAVVDDDAQVRVALRSLLRSDGLEVREYGSAEDYLQTSPRDPDCLIVDVSMPGRSGPELVEQLRALGRSVPTIFISGRELPLAPRLQGAELAPFFRKPFGDEGLLEAVRKALSRRLVQREGSAWPGRGSAPIPSFAPKEISMIGTPLRAVEDAALDLTMGDDATPPSFSSVVGSDAGLAATVRRAQLLTKVDAPLLLWGETGVGKELFARALHGAGALAVSGTGSSAEAPFVVLNCAGLPPELLSRELFGYVDGAFAGALPGGRVGKLEAAHGGTLFLDEIGDLPVDLQPYLLRVLESGEFYPLGSNAPRAARFRLIAASSRDPRAAARAEQIRMDLYFRISVTTLQIPPLRERRHDVPVLVRHFAAEAIERHQLSPKSFELDVMNAFEHYSWPGNVRELRNLVESLCLLAESGRVDLSMLPDELQPRASVTQLRASERGFELPQLPRGLQKVERAAIEDALRAYAGNLTRVAQELQIARSTLYLKLKKYELDTVLTELRFGGR